MPDSAWRGPAADTDGNTSNDHTRASLPSVRPCTRDIHAPRHSPAPQRQQLPRPPAVRARRGRPTLASSRAYAVLPARARRAEPLQPSRAATQPRDPPLASHPPHRTDRR
eukprot:3786744-Rhodomonas_salina.1